MYQAVIKISRYERIKPNWPHQLSMVLYFFYLAVELIADTPQAWEQS